MQVYGFPRRFADVATLTTPEEKNRQEGSPLDATFNASPHPCAQISGDEHSHHQTTALAAS